MVAIHLVERCSSVEEYCHLIAAVGWKPRDREASARAFTLCGLCRERRRRHWYGARDRR